MTTQELPLSGYSIITVYSTNQELRHKDAGEPAEHGSLRVGWDWRWVEHRVFEVSISVALEPAPSRDEFSIVNAVGRFRQVGESQTPTLEEFVRLQAVAILLPYARQFLTSLTANSIYGAYYLHTLNVVQLTKDFDPAKTTGARQGAPNALKGKTKAAARQTVGSAKGDSQRATRTKRAKNL